MGTSELLVRRYRDAYRVAWVVTSIGHTLKITGWVVGLLFLAFAIFGSRYQTDSSISTIQATVEGIGLFLTVTIAILGWLCFFVLGTLFSAAGQILRATLDTAVHTSPFLPSDAKLAAMWLPNHRRNTPTTPGGAAAATS